MKIEVKNGCFSYDGKINTLDNISFSAGSGDLVSVLGPNGAGKTTLLKCVLGFLKWKSGETYIDGKNIRTVPRREMWQKIAYVPQAREAVSAYTVLETILLGRTRGFGIFSQPTEKDILKCEDIIEKLNIKGIGNKKCSEISGGELQMVLIARALVSEPQMLVLDEPESNLDFRNQLIVLDVMSQLAADGMICIFNTHYPAHALTRANKSILLSSDGSCVYGDTGSIVTEENISKIFRVKTVIGEIETPENMLRSIMPVSLSEDVYNVGEMGDPRKIAVISVISGNNDAAEKINGYLHEYSRFFVGRMGMPYRKCGVYIINVTLDAPESKIKALVSKLTLIRNISVKTTYAQGIFDGVENE